MSRVNKAYNQTIRTKFNQVKLVKIREMLYTVYMFTYNES